MKTIIQSIIMCACLLWAALAQGASFVQGITATLSETNPAAVVQMQRTGDPETTVSVDYATQNGTATNGGDFVATSGTLTFLPGVSNLTVSISLINDAMPELSEYFTLVLTNPTGGATVSASHPRINVTDNDLGIRMSAGNYTNAENAGVALVTVLRGEDENFPASVTYYTVDSVARAGSDYEATSGTLEFADGELSKTVAIPLANDFMPEPNENFLFRLGTVTGPTVLGTPAVALIKIMDNDKGIRLASANYTNAENGGLVLVTVTRDPEQNFPVTVAFYTTNGTALAGTDYVATNGILEFSAEEHSKMVAIAIIDDFTPEQTENFQFRLGAVGGATVLGTPNNALITIQDNDLGINLEQATYSVHYAPCSVTIGIVADPQIPGTATVAFYTTNGTALAGVNYRATNGVLTFGPGQTYQTVTIPILNAGMLTANRSFSFRLGAVTGPTGLGTNQTATITIEDLSFIQSSLSGPADTWMPHWVDYDNDGLVELIMQGSYWGTNVCGVYENPGDGTLVRVLTNAFATTQSRWWALAWADYDNDGDLDCFAGMWEGNLNRYFRNDGGGNFTPIIADRNWIANGVDVWGSCASAVDLDGDGILDVVGGYYGDQGGGYGTNRVLRGLGDGRFEAILNSPLALSGIWPESTCWVDYDDDGDLDWFISTSNTNIPDFLYRNQGDGNFVRVTNALTTTIHEALGSAWGDYDNDGDMDVWSGNFGHPNKLFRNQGQGQFMPDGSTIIGGNGHNGGWADYDNDGYLDLFITYAGTHAQFYRNNGNGTLSEVVNIRPAKMIVDSYGPAWADYNNDGFMDLTAGNSSGNYLLFRNNLPQLGSTNHWLKIKPVGTASNRSAIGAKIRMRATIGSKTFWQLRQIACHSLLSELTAHFGLGDATAAEVVRIEWPSGMVQEITNVVANQFLTITEPPKCVAPCVMGGHLEFTLTGNLGDIFELVEADTVYSNDWAVRQTITLTSRTMKISEPANKNTTQKFYRIRRVP